MPGSFKGSLTDKTRAEKCVKMIELANCSKMSKLSKIFRRRVEENVETIVVANCPTFPKEKYKNVLK